MVAIHSSRPPVRRRRKLAEVLEKAVEDLEALRDEANRLAAHDPNRSRDQLCPRALQALATLAQEGRAVLLKRLGEIRPRGSSGVMAGTEPLAAAERAPGRPALLAWNDLSRFMTSFRRCGRHLCLALREAHEVVDTATADAVFHLLHDLERQLWLVDAHRGRLPIAGEADLVLQAC
jgi:hypothetical protein